MNDPRFGDLSSEEQDWLEDYLNGTMDQEAFESFQDRLLEKAELRIVVRRYLALDHGLREHCDRVSESSEQAISPWLQAEPEEDSKGNIIELIPKFVPIAAAATLAFFLGLALMYWKAPTGSNDDAPPDLARLGEPSAKGFAVIEKLFDASWVSPGNSFREGDMLGAEILRLSSGIAKMQFFSGATMIVEGPAEISLKSAWEAICLEGRIRMQVPPAARGFKLQAPGTEIIDLGTEFGLVVRDGKGHLEVLDGEVAVRRDGREQLLKMAEALEFQEQTGAKPGRTGQVAFPDLTAFESRTSQAQQISFSTLGIPPRCPRRRQSANRLLRLRRGRFSRNHLEPDDPPEPEARWRRHSRGTGRGALARESSQPWNFVGRERESGSIFRASSRHSPLHAGRESTAWIGSTTPSSWGTDMKTANRIGRFGRTEK